ncbi:hypothetical protein ANO14919_073450 [Xylariales sp. No.14919]|nr:hypothetical protein F5X98DRAFT_377629 [Xylaria grammica]GAW17878.1 hypothetical protein ANO14919_073450 [Xylariales sp. No.14919]
MAPRRMDHESAQRIIKARGRRDSFSKRAEMTARNLVQGEDKEQGKSSEQQNAEKKKDEKDKKADSGSG